MSSTYLNFLPLIELYLDQQESIKDSIQEVKESEARLDQLLVTLQNTELNLKQVDAYLLAKSSVENLKRIQEEYEKAQERTKLHIMEILLSFPRLEKIKLNDSRENPQYLSWDLENGTFILSGFDSKNSNI